VKARTIIAAGIIVLLAATGAGAVDNVLGTWGGGTWSSVVDGNRTYSWAAAVNTDFVMVWTVPNTDAVYIPTVNGSTYSGTIDWGDGGGDQAFSAWNDADFTNSYSGAGTYTITIKGTFERIYFNAGAMRNMLVSVANLGDVGWKSFYRGFYNCDELTNIAGTAEMGGVTSWQEGIRDCAKLVSVASRYWDVSNVASFLRMAKASTKLAEMPIELWDMGSCVTVYEMFFNTGILEMLANNLDVADVVTFVNWLGSTDMTNCEVANLDIGKAETLAGCLGGNIDLPQLDLSTWVPTNVENCSSVVTGNSGMTNLNLTGWNGNMDKVTTLLNFAENCSLLRDTQILDIPPLCTTAESIYGGCAALTNDFSTATNESTTLAIWTCTSSSLQYLSSNGFFSANTMHGFNTDCGHCGMTTTSVDNILVDLDVSGATNMTIAIAGDDAAPTGVGAAAITNMVDNKACTITAN